jgi:hypothetical protein
VGTLSAALGFHLHTGWAAAVALTGWTSAPRVVDRRRFTLVESAAHDARFAYHAAAELEPGAAARHVATVQEVARRRAHVELKQLLSDLEAAGYSLCAVGLPQAKGPALRALSEVLRSHTMIHTAEGELFRAALVEACETQGLPVIGVPSKERYRDAARAMGIGLEKLKATVAGLGRPLGPPWTHDQKEAALAALIAGGAGVSC